MKFKDIRTANEHTVLVQDDEDNTIALISNHYGIKNDKNSKVFKIFTQRGHNITSKVLSEIGILNTIDVDELKEYVKKLGLEFFISKNSVQAHIVMKSLYGITYFYSIDTDSYDYDCPIGTNSTLFAVKMPLQSAKKRIKEWSEHPEREFDFIELEYEGDKIIEYKIVPIDATFDEYA